MTNRQYKDAFLRSKITECLSIAKARVGLDNTTALEHLSRALAFARQLPPTTPKNRAIRAHIATAIEVLNLKDYSLVVL